MKSTIRIACLVAAAGIAGPALAQDSVSRAQGLPGDALSPFTTNTQVTNYVVDLAPLTTSWGTQFGIAPIAKSSKVSGLFFSTLISAQAVSPDILQNVPARAQSYSLWTAPGFGVNPDANLNTPGSLVTPPASTTQIGFAFADFDGNANNTVGGFINFDPNRPGRLFVQRVVGNINATNAPLSTESQLGLGTVDANGNVYVRADGNVGVGQVAGPNNITGNNYFRVRLADRNAGVVNVLNNLGGSDATDGLLRGSTTTHNTPAMIPQSISATRPILGSRFGTATVGGSYVFGSSSPLNASVDHRGAILDHRGGISFNRATFWSNTVGTAAMLGKDNFLSGGTVGHVLIWGVDGNGAVVNTARAQLPIPTTGITDNDTGYNFVANTALALFGSQTAFRGGNGLVSLGRDQQGNALAAVTVAGGPLGTANNNPENAIAVARWNPTTGQTTWTLAAYVQLNNGKPIVDQNNNTIGKLIETNALIPTQVGPSLSAPMIDSVGNIWFMGVAEFPRGQFVDRDVVLLRAVYNPASFSYRLEKILEVGDVFAGQNSGRNYQIRFLELTDSNSISSGTTFTHNLVQGAFNGQSTSGLNTSDPRTLGGLVLQAEIVYDVDNDGQFIKVTGANGNPASLDQEYQTLLFISNLPGRCIPDFNNDGVVDINDFFAFLSAYAANDGSADVDGVPGIDINDFFFFLSLYSQGC